MKGRPTRLALIASALSLLAIVVIVWANMADLKRQYVATGSFGLGREYPTTLLLDTEGEHWGSWAGSDAATGRLVTEDFLAPPLLMMRVAGGTSRPNETIRLVRAGATIVIRTPKDAGEVYQQLWEWLPISWWGHHMHLEAIDAGGGYRGWLGIADVRGVSPLDLLQPVGSWALLIAVFALWLVLFVPFLVAVVDVTFAFPTAFALLGLCAAMAFFVTRWAQQASGFVVALLLIAVLAFGLRRAWTSTSLPHLLPADTWVPSVLILATALGYATVLASVASGAEFTERAAASAWLPLPSDSIIPLTLGDQALQGSPPEPFMGDWLSSDRPPLQSGFSILATRLFPGHNHLWLRYEAISLLAQCSIFAALYAFARALGAGIRAATLAVLLCTISGFFFLNDIYVWPKLLSATFGMLALTIGYIAKPQDWRAFALCGCAIGLSLLSHGGGVFSLPSMGAALVIAYRWQAVRPLLTAGAAALLVYAPWLGYQRFYDPPGDRLLKWHLAGLIPPHPEISAFAAIRTAYTAHPLVEIARLKLENFLLPLTLQFGTRPGELLYVLPALGLFTVPFVLLVAFARNPLTRRLRSAAFIALSSLIVWEFVMWTGTVIHQGSYITMALLFGTAAVYLTQWPRAMLAFALVQLALFGYVWMAGVVPPIGVVGLAPLVATAWLVSRYPREPCRRSAE